MFLKLNNSGLVASFDGSLTDVPSDISTDNDTLLIVQNIFVGPDGNINISTASNLNGLFEGNIQDERNGLSSSTEMSVTQNVREQLETEPTHSGIRPHLSQEVDLENIPDTDLRHIIMTYIPKLEPDMIEKISDILKSHGGRISLDTLHDTLRNIHMPGQPENVDERVLDAISEITETLYKVTAGPGPTRESTTSSVNQSDGDQSTRVFTSVPPGEQAVTATPTPTSINDIMEKPGDSRDLMPERSQLSGEDTGVEDNASPPAAGSDSGHDKFPITSESPGHNSSQSASGILTSNLADDDDSHQLDSSGPKLISTTTSAGLGRETTGGSNELAGSGTNRDDEESGEKTDQAIKLSDGGLAGVTGETQLNSQDKTITRPRAGDDEGSSVSTGGPIMSGVSESRDPPGPAQAISPAISSGTSSETADSSLSHPTTGSEVTIWKFGNLKLQMQIFVLCDALCKIYIFVQRVIL